MNTSQNINQLQQTALNLHRNGQLAQAEAYYRQILAVQAKNTDILHLLGVLCHQTERHEEAIRLIESAVALEPRNADYLNNLGLALRGSGQVERAITIYQRALKITPKDIDLISNLGNAFQSLERYEEAAGCYRRVLRVNPRDIEIRDAHCYALQRLGNQAHESGHYLQAEACYLEVTQLITNDAAVYYNLGNAQRELGKAAEAAASYRQSLKLAPGDADIHNNLGNVLRELAKLDEAIACYQAALEINPGLYHAKVHLVHQKQHICDWANLNTDIALIRSWVKSAPQAQISPFAFLAMPGTTAEEQRLCVDNWVKNRYQGLIQQGKKNAFEHRQASGSKLKIGYLSGDFRLHPLASLISELIELHDRSHFEIFAYSYSLDDKTTERQRLQKAFDHFVDIRPMSQQDAAKRIHADGIDILVDLTGFTQSSRTGIVALRPTPISVSWLGFPGTMGSLDGQALFDYLLSDAFITQPQHADNYAEQLALLPDCYQPNDRKRPIAKAASRAECSLPDDAFVFCCFNQTFKILPDMFDIWMRLLQAVPNSVLWLLECNSRAKANLLNEAQARGVAPSQLIFAPRVSMDKHLARHALADLFLDTLPYNAHTTTSDALWMGLPILTCVGETFAGRVAGSLLNAANLPELTTYNLQAYEARALALAGNPAELSSIKHKLLQTRDALPLFDTPAFTRHLEQIYQDIWAAKLAAKPN
ncbi:MAG TPA: tetratricopeptide repeat protein [Methylophilaceae bacterium]|nr:tetratricopeptide repeat protein [Methylophilaceae bacterium]